MAKESKKSSEQKLSGRARRKAEAAEAKKRRIYYVVGGIAAVIAILAIAFVVRERNQDDPLPEIVAAPDTEITALVNGRVAGDPEATVALVEWGDYQ